MALTTIISSVGVTNAPRCVRALFRLLCRRRRRRRSSSNSSSSSKVIVVSPPFFPSARKAESPRALHYMLHAVYIYTLLRLTTFPKLRAFAEHVGQKSPTTIRVVSPRLAPSSSINDAASPNDEPREEFGPAYVNYRKKQFCLPPISFLSGVKEYNRCCFTTCARAKLFCD